jgi:hypothetical protein
LFKRSLLALIAITVTSTSGADIETPAGVSVETSASVEPSGVRAPSLFRAVYKADYKGLPISAKGIRELSKTEDGHYLLSSKATSMFASIVESTEFRIDGDYVKPVEYQYHRSGIGKKRQAILNFDWDTMTVLNNVQNKPWTMDVPLGAMDKLLYQFKLRDDLLSAYENGDPWPSLSYVIADGGRLKHYEFEVIGEEVIDTPVGQLNTIKATRVRDNRDRTSTFWLAKDYDFMLVRFQQLEADGDGFELLLREAEFNGEDL